ncbi:MAG: phosphoribosylformylglycinamidine cyclo-ligase [Actinomycetia bacterium]|nr:phosphoribosylformylglycinamidine cyclo-ligase [Actinomycetes bacterium]
MMKPDERLGQISYRDAGVDIDEGARAVEAIRSAVQGTYTPAVIGDIGGFGGLYSAAALKGMHDPVLVSSTDGVGTKIDLARRLGRHNTIGIDLVAMCVNDLVASGAQPLFFLDYLACGRLEAPFAAELVGGIADGCRQAGCALVGGEMAEHPGVMVASSYDLAGFAVGVVERDGMLGSHRVQAGDALVGLASSGLHANGYSLVRRAFTDKLSDSELCCRQLADGRSLACALLAPTVIYVDLLQELLELGLPVRAAAHITGGGITENLNRILPVGLDAHLHLGSWPIPEIISLVCDAAGLSSDEALKTFNMGLGMILAVDANALDEIMAAVAATTGTAAATDGHSVWHVGSVSAAATAASPGRVYYSSREVLN